MKKYILLSLMGLLTIIASAQSPKYKASVCHTDGTKESIYTNAIDSITFSEKTNGYYQQSIWVNGVAYSNAIEDIDSISLKGAIIEYTVIEEAVEDIVGGIVTSDGTYCLLQRNDSTDGFACYIGENESDNMPMIIKIDTLGVIRSIFCNEIIYDFVYNESSFDIIITEENNTKKISNVSYDIFGQVQAAKVRRKAGGTSNGVDGWAEMANKISTIASIGQIASNPKALSSKVGVLTLIGGMSDNKYVRRSSIAIDLIMSLKNGGIFGTAWGLYQLGNEYRDQLWFGDVQVTTLSAEHITDTKYRVWCSITNFSKISDPDIMGARLMMTLEKRPVILGNRLTGNIKSETKDVLSDGAYYFEFDGLELGKQYCFQPRLYRTWVEYHSGAENMTVSDIFLYGGAIPGGGGIATVNCTSDIYMYGEIGTFATNSSEIESIETKKTEATRGHVNFTIEVKGKVYAAPNNDKETLGQGSLGVYIKNGDEYKHYPATSISGNNFTAELSFEESIYTMDNVDYSTFISTKKIEIGSYVMAYRQSGQYDYENVYYYSEPQEYELVYDVKPTVTFTNVQIGSPEAYPQYDDDGEFLYNYYSAALQFDFNVKGAFWMNYIQSFVYGGDWTDSEGPIEIVDDGSYSNPSSMGYYDGGDMYFVYSYHIYLLDGSTISSNNSVVFGGTPTSPSASIGGAPSHARSYKAPSAKQKANSNTKMPITTPLFCPRK